MRGRRRGGGAREADDGVAVGATVLADEEQVLSHRDTQVSKQPRHYTERSAWRRTGSTCWEANMNSLDILNGMLGSRDLKYGTRPSSPAPVS